MRHLHRWSLLACAGAVTLLAACSGLPTMGKSGMSFFVTSVGPGKGGDLGGILLGILTAGTKVPPHRTARLALRDGRLAATFAEGEVALHQTMPPAIRQRNTAKPSKPTTILHVEPNDAAAAGGGELRFRQWLLRSASFHGAGGELRGEQAGDLRSGRECVGVV